MWLLNGKAHLRTLAWATHVWAIVVLPIIIICSIVWTVFDGSQCLSKDAVFIPSNINKDWSYSHVCNTDWLRFIRELGQPDSLSYCLPHSRPNICLKTINIYSSTFFFFFPDFSACMEHYHNFNKFLGNKLAVWDVTLKQFLWEGSYFVVKVPQLTICNLGYTKSTLVRKVNFVLKEKGMPFQSCMVGT